MSSPDQAPSWTDPGIRANAVGLLVNVGLAVSKFAVGAAAGSAALVADGFNSAGDVVATAIGWAGYRMAQRPPDDNHHYGHGKFEAVAGLIIGGLLLATGIFVTVDGVLVLLEGPRTPPSVLALWVALGTAGIKELLYRYVSGVAERLNSPSLRASARDHRADVFIALTVVCGVAAARFGAPWLDPAAAVLIGLYIAYMAYEPIRDNAGTLMDEAPADVRDAVVRAAVAVDEVRAVDAVRVHPLGSHFVVDLEIYVDGDLSLHDAHRVAHAVSDRVRDDVAHVRDVKVHVNPTGVG